MTKQQMIDKLNATDDFKEFGFEAVADDGQNTLLRRKWGTGYMLLNRFEDLDTEIYPVYSADVSGWKTNR